MLPQIINILINCSNIQFRKENVTLKFKKLNHFELVSNYDYYKNKNDLLSTLIKIYSMRERQREGGGAVILVKRLSRLTRHLHLFKNSIQIYIFDSNVHPYQNVTDTGAGSIRLVSIEILYSSFLLNSCFRYHVKN